MIYTKEVEEMCTVKRGASHMDVLQFLKKENGYIQEKSKIFLV